MLLGKNYGNNVFGSSGASASTSSAVKHPVPGDPDGLWRHRHLGQPGCQAAQPVRHDLHRRHAGRPTRPSAARLIFPTPARSVRSSGLGTIQQNQPYPAQYSMAGGNVSINAQNDITHQTLIGGVLTADSSHELPMNWLYRRGYIDPTTGQFGDGHSTAAAARKWVPRPGGWISATF